MARCQAFLLVAGLGEFYCQLADGHDGEHRQRGTCWPQGVNGVDQRVRWSWPVSVPAKAAH